MISSWPCQTHRPLTQPAALLHINLPIVPTTVPKRAGQSPTLIHLFTLWKSEVYRGLWLTLQAQHRAPRSVFLVLRLVKGSLWYWEAKVSSGRLAQASAGHRNSLEAARPKFTTSVLKITTTYYKARQPNTTCKPSLHTPAPLAFGTDSRSTPVLSSTVPW